MSKYRTLFSQAGMDVVLAALAADQHGVFALFQLTALGLSASAVRSRVATGRLYRVYPGVYALTPPSLLTIEGRYMAAVLACGPGAALSHRSAAALRGLRRTQRSGLDVTVPNRSCRRHAGLDVHRSTTLRPEDVTRVRGIPCTTIARTILDMAEVIQPRQLEAVFEQADQMELLDLRALGEQVALSPTRVGASRVKKLIDEYEFGLGVTWSDLERDFKAMIAPAAIPMPLINHFIVLSDGGEAIRRDFYWPEYGLVVETDGWRTHRTRAAVERDRRNDQRLTVAGYLVVRMTYRQIHREPARMVAIILKLMDRRGRSGAGSNVPHERG
jgi:Transcriptional regulator, AbiEi antitoxin/Protein of unknown function (DUF559)